MPLKNNIPQSASNQLRRLLKGPDIIMMAACYDALTARLVEAAGFPASFMSGFGVAASRLGLPDTGLISYGEMLDQGRNICGSVSIPILGDGDTGFGNALNVKRSVNGYHQAGFACIMIEDQKMPKRCGHTTGKEVINRDEALLRLQAAVDARKEGADILIMARTDARETHGLEEAIKRCKAFYQLGADITFLEAPHSEAEMRSYCENVPGPKMANLLEDGKTPQLSPQNLQDMGYKIGVYPLTLLNASITAMQQALASLKKGRPACNLMGFKELRELVGFTAYDNELSNYHRN